MESSTAQSSGELGPTADGSGTVRSRVRQEPNIRSLERDDLALARLGKKPVFKVSKDPDIETSFYFSRASFYDI